jgi:EVE domain
MALDVQVTCDVKTPAICVGRSYWAQVYTRTTWQEFLNAGANVTGFRATSRWTYIQNELQKGDYLLCYIKRVASWVGVLETVSEPFLDFAPIFQDQAYSGRVNVQPVAILPFEDSIPIRSMQSELSIFSLKQWGVRLICSPIKWEASDGISVYRSIVKAAGENRKSLSAVRF